jgi:hypothetical protein
LPDIGTKFKEFKKTLLFKDMYRRWRDVIKIRLIVELALSEWGYGVIIY